MTSHFSIYGRSFLVGICLFSNLISQYNGDDIIRKGVDAFYNYNYDLSNEILDKAIFQFPFPADCVFQTSNFPIFASC